MLSKMISQNMESSNDTYDVMVVKHQYIPKSERKFHG